MQALHKLIHSLSKDEKRLYHQHRRNTRLQPIYDGYLKATQYSRQLDKSLFEDHYQDVSRAFYSMLKRELQEELVTVLLEYTNSTKSAYRFARSYARAVVLLNRNLTDTAADYLKEANQHAQLMHSRADQLRVMNLEKELAPVNQEQDLATFQQLLEQENRLQQHYQLENQLKSAKIALRLLRRQQGQTPELTTEEVARQAHEVMKHLDPLRKQLDELDLVFDYLEVEALYSELVQNPLRQHKLLHQEFEKRQTQLDPTARQRFINLLMHSALRVGDFLLLNSLIYKHESEVEQLPAEDYAQLAPDFLEAASLFLFYEQESGKALELSERLVQLPGTDSEQHLRRLVYRFAMLLATHLHKQLLEEWRQLKLSQPTLRQQPLLQFQVLMARVDDHQKTEDLSFEADAQLQTLRKARENKPLQEALQQTSRLLEGDKLKLKPFQVLPQGWEPLLRPDLWLQAKQENQFYYELLCSAWRERRQVL